MKLKFKYSMLFVVEDILNMFVSNVELKVKPSILFVIENPESPKKIKEN